MQDIFFRELRHMEERGMVCGCKSCSRADLLSKPIQYLGTLAALAVCHKVEHTKGNVGRWRAGPPYGHAQSAGTFCALVPPYPAELHCSALQSDFAASSHQILPGFAEQLICLASLVWPGLWHGCLCRGLGGHRLFLEHGWGHSHGWPHVKERACVSQLNLPDALTLTVASLLQP